MELSAPKTIAEVLPYWAVVFVGLDFLYGKLLLKFAKAIWELLTGGKPPVNHPPKDKPPKVVRKKTITITEFEH